MGSELFGFEFVCQGRGAWGEGGGSVVQHMLAMRVVMNWEQGLDRGGGPQRGRERQGYPTPVC